MHGAFADCVRVIRGEGWDAGYVTLEVRYLGVMRGLGGRVLKDGRIRGRE